jgi:hypothetical protein
MLTHAKETAVTRSRYLFALLAVPIMAAMAATARVLEHAAARVADFVLALFPSEPSRLAVPGFSLKISIDGDAVPADIQQALRHEAGVARRSAARHT